MICLSRRRRPVGVCRGVLRDKLTAPETVEFEPFTVKRKPTTQMFVGAGQATAAMYDEMVKVLEL